MAAPDHVEPAGIHLAADSDPPPTAVPGYELLEKVGEGGMGAVYRARQLSLQRVVAIKFLRGRAAGESEPRLLASLNHPNVLSIHDYAVSQGLPYLVTEYVPGTSLRALMKAGEPWPVAK